MAVLLITTVLTSRQIILLRKSHYIPIVDLITEFRFREFYDEVIYVTDRLRSECDPALGISGLPESARSSLLDVAYYFQAFAWFFELGVLREKHLRVVASRIVLTWEAIQPYVETERKATKGPVLVVLERGYEALTARGA
ncbi:MAG: hypothetical protein ABW215_19195 [Kibdelosporangium sp.]